MTRTYSRWKCWICKKTMSNNGLAKINHCRKHVREGLLIERKVKLKWYPYGAIEFDLAVTEKELYANRN